MIYESYQKESSVMFNLNTKAALIPLADIVVRRDLNVREQGDDTYIDLNLMEDLLLHGQQDDGALEQLPDGKYHPLKGNRRVTMLNHAASLGRKFEETAPKDSAGKVPTVFRAKVYKDLTEIERLIIMLDHGNRRGLNKAELFFAAEKGFTALATEKQICSMLSGLLEIHYPPRRPIEPTPEAKLAYYRGVIQTMKRAAVAPVILRDAWVENLRGKQGWPTKGDMEQLSDIHTKEVKADSTGKFNRQNPGPLFKAAWDKMMTQVNEAAAKGDSSRAKSTSMMNRANIESLASAAQSRTMKIIVKIVMRDIADTASVYPVFDGALSKLEKGEITGAEYDAILDQITAPPAKVDDSKPAIEPEVDREGHKVDDSEQKEAA